MRMMTILVALDKATVNPETGPEVARLLREAAAVTERTWPGALPGPGGTTTVVALRNAAGGLFGTASFGDVAEKKE